MSVTQPNGLEKEIDRNDLKWDFEHTFRHTLDANDPERNKLVLRICPRDEYIGAKHLSESSRVRLVADERTQEFKFYVDDTTSDEKVGHFRFTLPAASDDDGAK